MIKNPGNPDNQDNPGSAFVIIYFVPSDFCIRPWSFSPFLYLF